MFLISISLFLFPSQVSELWSRPLTQRVSNCELILSSAPGVCPPCSPGLCPACSRPCVVSALLPTNRAEVVVDKGCTASCIVYRRSVPLREICCCSGPLTCLRFFVRSGCQVFLGSLCKFWVYLKMEFVCVLFLFSMFYMLARKRMGGIPMQVVNMSISINLIFSS